MPGWAVEAAGGPWLLLYIADAVRWCSGSVCIDTLGLQNNRQLNNIIILDIVNNQYIYISLKNKLYKIALLCIIIISS